MKKNKLIWLRKKKNKLISIPHHRKPQQTQTKNVLTATQTTDKMHLFSSPKI